MLSVRIHVYYGDNELAMSGWLVAWVPPVGKSKKPQSKESSSARGFVFDGNGAFLRRSHTHYDHKMLCGSEPEDSSFQK
jgi:hypothetical protein